MNAIGFAGLHILTAGSYTGEVYEDIREDSYKKLFFEGNLLKGYILIGDVERAGIYTSLIRNRTPLDEIDFELVCEKPQLMAFKKKNRKTMLGGQTA
jgi:NAD(P)H-nitrite reductase large subunit